jgi:Tfp pilus assembly protein PilX
MKNHYIQKHSAPGNRATGSALLITLAFLVLVTILVVGIMTTVRLERVSASSNFESRRAKSLAMLGVDNAGALIRTACENGTQAGKFWASQPGKITVFSADGTEDVVSSRFLFSTNSGNSTVDLNQAGFGGVAPIASANSLGTNATPAMPVSWESVLQDPSAPASATNRIVGRYAFWVDDESAKLNVNTADGTAKNTTNSFGPGTPTDVSLTALKTGGTGIPAANAEAISTRSGARYTNSATQRPFNDPSEILQASGVSTNLVADNNFNLTHYSRSPDLNIFGEPQIPLLTTTTDAAGTVLNAMIGPYGTIFGRTLIGLGGPLTCTYPLSSQLPAFTAPATSWPTQPKALSPAISMAPPQSFPQDVDISANDLYFTSLPTQQVDKVRNANYAMGLRIARYLKGFNSQGTAIQWPVFPGADTGGFSGKYTDRQIDSMALQILAMLSKGTFADNMFSYTTPYIMPQGFLSGKLVRGLALAPRINEILIEITTAAGSSPRFNIAIWIETYVPSEFQVGNSPLPAGDWGFGGGREVSAEFAPLISRTSHLARRPRPWGDFGWTT